MKLKNLAGAFLAFACAAICGELRAGNVWEFIPDSPTGATYLPGEEITFRMRLLTPNYDMPPDKRTPWMLMPNMDNFEVSQTFLADPVNAMSILMGKHPFGIGVVANGKTYSASYVTENVTNENYGTDFTFRYPVQCGDFALPLRLAADRNGTPVNSWDPESSKASNRYFFFNGPDDANSIWKISTSNGDAFVPQMVGQAEAELTIMEREVLPYNSAGDYLRGFRWTLETLAFDEVTEPGDDGKDYWRCVRGTSRPTIVPTDGLVLDSGRRVYVWIAPAGGSDDDPSTWTGWTENDYAVTIPLDGDRNVAEAVFRDPDGTSRKHNVYTFTLAPGQVNYELRELKGLHVGGTARVILSGSPHWNMVGNGSTGTFLTTDYRMRTVYCGEQKPTISVSLDNYSTTAAVVFPNANHELRDYTRAERLRVRLEGVDVHEAFKVNLKFDLAGDAAFPTNVIAISTDEAAGYLDKNLLKGMEVSFAENADEATESEDGLYLFILGATTNTAVNPGITITPVPNASLTATVQKTNALHVVIKGINPVVTAVNDVDAEPGVPVAVKEVRGGGNLECRVRIEDSYRNLRLLDAGGTDGVYTVTFNRGYGNNLTITNNAAGGALVPTDYFSDGYAYLDFKVPYTSITNTYTATFKLKNPDGLESKTYVLTVPVIPSAKVAASAPEGKVTSDGFYELVEDGAKSYRIDFTLSDTLEAEAAGYDKLYAFLEPVNEAASNRTDGAFFTKKADGTAGTGVPIDMLGENRGKGSTAWGAANGGIQILDGDGAGDGSGQMARYNVILCTQPTYSNEFVFAGYDGSTTKFTLILDNHEPTLSQLVLWEVIKGTATTNDVDVITASGKTAANRVHKGNDVIVGPMTKDDWKDVPLDIDATNKNLMVTRWLVYRVNDSGEKERWDAYYTYGPDEKLVIPGGLTVYGGKDTTYLFEVQIQDKDMRALGTAGLVKDEDEPSGWAYRVYKNLPNFEPDWAGDDEANVWGPLFTFTVVASDKPNVDIAVREEGSTLVQGVRAFSEDQLTPLNGSIYNDDDMRLVVSLAEQFDRKTEVKVLLTLSAVDDMDVNGGFVKLAETNVYFVGANRTTEVKISDFDATYRDGKVQRGNAKYQVKAEVVEPDAAVEKFNATTCQFFVVNRPPRLELGAGSQQFADGVVDPELAYDAVKNEIQTVDWSATDIYWDLTNISVKATISGGKIIDGTGAEYTTYAYTATNSAVVATNYEDGAYNVSFRFKFTSSGTNTITFVATDKDGDSSERQVLRFAVPETKTLMLFPMRPAKQSSDSDDIADYLSAGGIGYGRVWATSTDGTKLSAIEEFGHDWTCSDDGVIKVHAIGYMAYEREDVSRSQANFNDAFVNVIGTHDTAVTGYLSPTAAAGYDNFFYRFFKKTVSDSGQDGSWTPEKPVLQLGTNDAVSTSLSFPKQVGMNDRVYNDMSAIAIFSREYIKSDNMGDINADGVPDSYVVKYKLVEEYAGGNDLKDVNFAEDGKTPNCQDYLPQALTVRYSQLIPELTEISNIENAEAFTPRLKIRGYDETDVQSLARRETTYGVISGISALNDAAQLAGIDGANPDRRYTNPREDADSTLNYVEYLAWSEYAAANRLDPTNAVNWTKWSPERPTDPTKADFDNDGFTDGYEYYVWYRAHVGYLEGNVHKYLTGRAYDPRNPGEGTFITSEKIKQAFDPRQRHGSETDDIDNDGLPDLIEFELGTNPFDFDTDGDGLPDGFEIIVAGTDPLSDHTAKDAKHDAARNYDGDAMAFTTVKREAGVLPQPRFIQKYFTFATVRADGDTDGIQWYVETPLDGGVSAFTYTNGTPVAGVKFTAGGVDYITTNGLALADGRLAATLDPSSTFVATNVAAAAEALGVTFDESVEWVILRPARLSAGTPITETNAVTCANASVLDLAAEKDCNAAWVYGSEKVNVAGSEFGFLALGRYKLPEAGAVVAELPTKDRDVAFLHYLVYQQFGFDPRTAWSWKTPLAARWGENSGDLSYADQTSKKTGYAGTATRTRAFTAYDEFLLYSFFLNNGCDMSGYTEAAAEAPYLAKVWMAFCTNPRGVGEPEWASDTHYQGWTAKRDENGCDTDGDGVPDGWELYVMAGPKMGKEGKADPKNGMFVFAPPYAAFTAAGDDVIEMPESYFSPFVDSAKNSETDNKSYIGKDMNDGLTEYQEFASTDACAWYDEVQDGETAAYAKTPLLPADWTWLNKFFPTDPWVPDTDDDGVKDNEEGSAFTYAEAADIETYKSDKLKTVYPGCGLNPCSVDTDMDGLPDGWEKQFAGSTVSTNAVEGYVDGMDGTVADAQTDPQKGPNRDYDRDGLENWQEYLTGTMRCWRYDDPFTQWGSIPFEAYYYYDADGFLMFEPDFEALGIEGDDEDELWNNFWYETLAHVGGPIYNPHLVFDQSPTAQYFSRVDKGWDPNYFDKTLMGEGDADDDKAGSEHRYYWFAHRIGEKKYSEAWAEAYGENGWFSVSKIDPKYYISCSPICEDSDQDGMDDYYELFHGLNPLLGGSATPSTINPCDLVWANVAKDRTGPANWSANPWIARPFAKARGTNPDFDFTVYPWKNGLQTVDPDGDNERNNVEAIMAKFDSTTGFHGDPSPMWMTDASYSNSLTRLHYRLPMRSYGAFMSTTVTDRNGDTVPGFTGPDGTAYFFRDFDAYSMNDKAPGTLEGFSVDRWKVGGGYIDPRVSQLRYDRGQESVGGWMFSFEENEGYDTDHDGLNDEAEIAGRAHGATDPIDADSPRRRQAMYFPGADSALQTPPQLIEQHPIVGGWYDEEFPFREYTVECWVRPDDIRNATVIERAILTAGANAGDRELVRKNFQLAIRTSGDKGYWFTKFDSNGTGTTDSDEVSVLSADEVVPGVWTHLAVTFDGTYLTLYVNGSPSGKTADTTVTKQQPECGVSEINISTGGTVAGGILKTDDYEDGLGYGYHAIVVGASLRSYSDYDLPFTEQWCGYALNLYNALGWRFYRDFFKGYVDEIRIWDGARDVDEISGSMGVRFTAEMAKENRSTVYKQWATDMSRYRKNGSGDDYEGVEPELRYHFSFDSLLAADSAEALAKVPTGFANGPSAPYSRPDGYEIAWWKRILGAYGSAYAGAANYVTWIPNTVSHLPRFDGTTLDSAFWSADFAGDTAGTYSFANAAEPYSLWTQWLRGNIIGEGRSTLLRYSLANGSTNALSNLMSTFMFTGRNKLCEGCDLLPLGGAYARYCEAMWDGLGAGTVHEITGNDADSDGLPDWWEKYADEQYRGDLDPSVKISWNTIITYNGMRIIAGEAYLRDLAKGTYADANGVIRIGPTAYEQTAKSDGMIPDWWKSLYKIGDADPLDDTDNDGLNNYVEYVASELLPFRLNLNPRLARTDTKTLDFFLRIGRLYLGEMLTDHDQMEDHWERSLGDDSIASAALWDALKDGEEDGWVNFAENRYNGYSMSTLAQLVAHAMGDTEVLDAPIPSLKMKVRYNGDRPLVLESQTGDGNLIDGGDGTEFRTPALIVTAFSKNADTGSYGMNPDAIWSIRPGVETAEKSVYLGGWEKRIVRGTLAPGNVNYGSIDLKFAQIPQNDRYSWSDESGLLHLARPYKEFKEALEKNPEIIQNIQNFEWLSLVQQGEDSDAVTVTRDEQSQQNAQIAVYGERVGTLDLTTGDFEFDMDALVTKMRVPYTFDSSKTEKSAWSYKEAIFKMVYTAKVPSSQLGAIDFSLAKSDPNIITPDGHVVKAGFVRGGLNSFQAFYDLNNSGVWDPGEPFGVVNDVEIGWAGRDVEIELSDMSAVTPRVKLWGTSNGKDDAKQTTSGDQEEQTGGRAMAEDSDRGVRVGTATFEDGDDTRFEVGNAPAPKSRVRVVRYKVDGEDVYTLGVNAGVVLEKDFEQTSRDFLHEGDFLTDGGFDIDWDTLYEDVSTWRGVLRAGCEVTNVTYLVVFNWDKAAYQSDQDTNTAVRAHSTLVTRRFERVRSVPVTCPERAVYNQSRPTFKWRIDNEDKWASWFGTTYTAFKLRVKDLDGKLVYDSGIRRLPAQDASGVYTWTAPLYVGTPAPGTGVMFKNLTDYTWDVAVYNAKFSTDDLISVRDNEIHRGNAFSTAETFRMNVTSLDASSEALAVRVCYTGPAANLMDRLHVQAFTTPDFTGDPVAETVIRYLDTDATTKQVDSLSPAGSDANVKIAGLPAGSYFLRAYIDTNGNGVRDDWESWGYLNERDLASKPGIFNPVRIETSLKPAETGVRKVFIEDCDTDGDWFPDVWEAEQNGGEFDRTKKGPLSGSAELLGVNPELKSVLDISAFPMLEALSSRAGLALISGIPPTRIGTIERSDGTLGITIDNTVESVRVTGFDFTANGNVSITVDAVTTAASIDESLVSLYALAQSGEMDVVCKIYRKAKLSDKSWTLAGSSTVRVGGGPVTITVQNSDAGNGGFYKAEISEK